MNYSVVIPAYNAQDTIKECLDSVFTQTLAPEQVIIIDDGSTDETVNIVKRLYKEIILIRQKNTGPGAATSNGFNYATSTLIATLDADDVWVPHKLETQIRHLDENPDLDGVFCHIQNFGGKSESQTVTAGWIRSTMLIRRETQKRIGPMIDPEPYGGEFVGWMGFAREIGCKFEILPDCLALRRIRRGSLSYGKSESLVSGYLQVARAAILRKKQNEKQFDQNND